MAKLTTEARKNLPPEDFKGPKIKGKPSFPMPDKSHAQAALRLAPRSLHAGNITKGQEENIRAEAKRKLGQTGSAFGSARDKQRSGA